jgi:hypothetical protein
MQDDLDASHPELDIQILGVNERGQEVANASVSEGRDIPWLQDVDTDNNGQSDVWRDTWEVVYRDVVILDDGNVPVGVYNLTTYDLGNPENYDTLRQMLIDAALADQPPAPLEPGDANGDYRFDQADLILVVQGGKYRTGEPATWQEGDWNGDGVFDRLDVVAALRTGNYLQGTYAATAEVSHREDPAQLAQSDPPSWEPTREIRP